MCVCACMNACMHVCMNDIHTRQVNQSISLSWLINISDDATMQNVRCFSTPFVQRHNDVI